MSYSRFGPNSDVYVYAHADGFIECCMCSLYPHNFDSFDEPLNWDYHSIEDIVNHMKEHVKAGDNVPSRLLLEETYSDKDFIPYESPRRPRSSKTGLAKNTLDNPESPQLQD